MEINAHIKHTKLLYNAGVSTVNFISDNYIKRVAPKGFENTFSINVSCLNNCESVFSNIYFCNDNKSRYICASLSNFNLISDDKINLNVFMKDDNLGFYVSDNPQNSYSANLKNFREKWNKSLYSYIYEIPSFVPNNLNYNKLTSLLSVKNLTKATLAFSVGKIKISAKEIINNTIIEDRGYFPVICNNTQNGGRLFRVSISKDFAIDTLNKLYNSSKSSKLNLFSPYFFKTQNIVSNVSEDKIIMDIVLCDNKIYSAEASFNTPENLINAKLNITDDIMSFSLNDLGKNKVKKNDNIFNLCVKTQKNAYTYASLSYKAKNGARQAYDLILSDKIKNHETIDGKNIFSLSVYDLYNLMKELKI